VTGKEWAFVVSGKGNSYMSQGIYSSKEDALEGLETWLRTSSLRRCGDGSLLRQHLLHHRPDFCFQFFIRERRRLIALSTYLLSHRLRAALSLRCKRLKSLVKCCYRNPEASSLAQFQ
jgi:hypothetical protein